MSDYQAWYLKVSGSLLAHDIERCLLYCRSLLMVSECVSLMVAVSLRLMPRNL